MSYLFPLSSFRTRNRRPRWLACFASFLLCTCSCGFALAQDVGTHLEMTPVAPPQPIDGIWQDPTYAEGLIPAPLEGGSCPPGCTDRIYVQADALYLSREGDLGTTLSQAFALDDFDWELGGRITIGRQYDCLDGWEFTYMGPYEFDTSDQRIAGGTLQSRLIPAGGFVAADLSAFNNATFHRQEYESKLNSFELNRKWWGWDVMSLSLGLRYMQIDEDFTFTSRNVLAEEGALVVDTDNALIGGQIGLEMLNPRTRRLSFGVRTKLGLFANISELGSGVFNAGTTLVAHTDDEISFAFAPEVGVFTQYQLTPRIALRTGYEVLYIYGLALASDQELRVVHPGMNDNIDDAGDLLYHGGSVGVEVSF